MFQGPELSVEGFGCRIEDGDEGWVLRCFGGECSDEGVGLRM